MIFYPWDTKQWLQKSLVTVFSVDRSNAMESVGDKDVVELPALIHTPDGSKPDRQAVKTRLMLLLHAQYPGLDYLMLETVVEHYLNHPEDGPDEIIEKGKTSLQNYFMPPDSKGPTVRFKHDPYPDLPKEPLEDLDKLTLEESDQEETGSSCDVEHGSSSLPGSVSRGTQTSGEGPERPGEQQSQSNGEL